MHFAHVCHLADKTFCSEKSGIMRYDITSYFNVRSKADISHAARSTARNRQLKSGEQEEWKVGKNGYAQKYRGISPEEEKEVSGYH